MPQELPFRAEEGNHTSQDPNGTAVNNLYRSDVRLTQDLHGSVLQPATTNVPDDQELQTWSLEQLKALAQQLRADESNLAHRGHKKHWIALIRATITQQSGAEDLQQHSETDANILS